MQQFKSASKSWAISSSMSTLYCAFCIRMLRYLWNIIRHMGHWIELRIDTSPYQALVALLLTYSVRYHCDWFTFVISLSSLVRCFQCGAVTWWSESIRYVLVLISLYSLAFERPSYHKGKIGLFYHRWKPSSKNSEIPQNDNCNK